MPKDLSLKPVPVNEPVISDQAKNYAKECLDTGWLSSAGPFVVKFEQAFASYIGVRHAVAVSNGTAALHAALCAIGIKPGDEVIVPAFTMMATIFAVMYTGATPVFVDCELDTFNIDILKIESKITPKTRAIIPVHLFGHAVEMDEINKMAAHHKLFVIEDAAEAHGGLYRGKKCGALSDISCFSLYANKMITAGEGGIICTNQDLFAAKLRKLRDLHHSDERRFIHDGLGYNYRITNVQSAIALGELENIDQYIAKKEWMAEQYTKRLSKLEGIRTPITRPYVKNVYWMYTILIDEKKFSISKDKLRGLLKESKIDTRDLFYPPEMQPVLTQKYPGMGTFPNAVYAAAHGCYLPSGLAITKEQIDHVADVIEQIYRRSHS